MSGIAIVRNHSLPKQPKSEIESIDEYIDQLRKNITDNERGFTASLAQNNYMKYANMI